MAYRVFRLWVSACFKEKLYGLYMAFCYGLHKCCATVEATRLVQRKGSATRQVR